MLLHWPPHVQLKVEERFFEQLCATMGVEEALWEASKKLNQEEKRQVSRNAHKGPILWLTVIPCI
jgi:hypothetical protein